MLKPPALAALLTFSLPSAASANDSVAEIGAGGLILVQADFISMEKEDLYVSPSEVRVGYVFRNTDQKDRTHLVAFPMPDIDPVDYMESDNGIPNQNADNFMDFKVTAGGKEIAPQLEMRALTAGIDISEKLKGFGIPLNPLSDAAREALKKAPPETLEALQVLGAIRVADGYADPAWSLRSTYYWMQTFPANAAIDVSHSYKPATGGTFFMESSLAEQYYKDTYCLDADTSKALAKKLAALPEDRRMMLTTTLEYILTTGANWMGPIKDFRLVIDKEKPSSIASFCLDGVKKIAPTQFEVRREDFWPEKNLKVLIVRDMED